MKLNGSSLNFHYCPCLYGGPEQTNWCFSTTGESAYICMFGLLPVSALQHKGVNRNFLLRQYDESFCLSFQGSVTSFSSKVFDNLYLTYFKWNWVLSLSFKNECVSESETDRKVDRKAWQKTMRQDLQVYSCSVLVCTADWTTNTQPPDFRVSPRSYTLSAFLKKHLFSLYLFIYFFFYH